MKKTLQDIQRMIKDQGIQMVDFKLTDIDGRWRHLSIPAERLDENIMKYGIGFDGSNYGYAPVENSDMVFIPILDSAVADRYTTVPTLSMTKTDMPSSARLHITLWEAFFPMPVHFVRSQIPRRIPIRGWFRDLKLL